MSEELKINNKNIIMYEFDVCSVCKQKAINNDGWIGVLGVEREKTIDEMMEKIIDIRKKVVKADNKHLDKYKEDFEIYKHGWLTAISTIEKQIEEMK